MVYACRCRPAMEDILLIDDDVELCEVLTEYLARYEFRVQAVHRGDSGLEAARHRAWPMILLDVMLPGMDGFEVLKQIRTFSQGQRDVAHCPWRRCRPHRRPGDRRRRLSAQTLQPTRTSGPHPGDTPATRRRNADRSGESRSSPSTIWCLTAPRARSRRQAVRSI